MTNDHPSSSGRARQICAFGVNNRLMGVDILDVKEINTETTFTPIFHAPKEVKGYVNIRGQIHLILDLRIIMDLPEKPVDEDSRLILFKPQVGEHFGILVDWVGDVLEIDETMVEDHRKTDQGAPEFGDEISGDVCKLKDGLLIILKAENLLNRLGMVA